MSKDRSWSLMGWKRSQQRFLLEKDLQVAPLYLCNPRNDFAVRFSGYGYRCYSLLHGEPEFLLRKTLNESEINIVVTVARGVKQSDDTDIFRSQTLQALSILSFG